jgi:hypothetical protein
MDDLISEGRVILAEIRAVVEDWRRIYHTDPYAPSSTVVAYLAKTPKGATVAEIKTATGVAKAEIIAVLEKLIADKVVKKKGTKFYPSETLLKLA